MQHDLVLISTTVNIWDRIREAIQTVNQPKGIELGEATMREYVAAVQAAFPDDNYSSSDTFTFMGLEVHYNPELHTDSIHVVGAVYN